MEVIADGEVNGFNSRGRYDAVTISSFTRNPQLGSLCEQASHEAPTACIDHSKIWKILQKREAQDRFFRRLIDQRLLITKFFSKCFHSLKPLVRPSSTCIQQSWRTANFL